MELIDLAKQRPVWRHWLPAASETIAQGTSLFWRRRSVAFGSDGRIKSAYASSSAILLGIVVAVLGIWLLTGDVELGALVIPRSAFFGVIALAAGALSLLGGGLSLLRSRRSR